MEEVRKIIDKISVLNTDSAYADCVDLAICKHISVYLKIWNEKYGNDTSIDKDLRSNVVRLINLFDEYVYNDNFFQKNGLERIREGFELLGSIIPSLWG